MAIQKNANIFTKTFKQLKATNKNFAVLNRRIKQLMAFAFAFTYAGMTAQIAQADDLDIYTKAAQFGTGGEPVLMFVIDTSGSMGWNMTNTSTSTNMLNERLFNLQSTVRDQLTSMKGTFKVGLTSYNGNSASSGIVRQESFALGDYTPTAGGGSVPTSGTYDEDVFDDVAQRDGGSVLNGQPILSLPFINASVGTQPIGTSLNGQWTNSAGATANLGSATDDYAGAVAGNKYVKYYADQSGTQVFWLNADGGSGNPDTYLYLLDELGNVIASNDDAAGSTSSCPAGYTYYSPWDTCYMWTVVGSQYVCETTGKGKNQTTTCDWEDVWGYDYEDPIETGGNLNSRIEYDIVAGETYILVAGTYISGQSGGFTLLTEDTTLGWFVGDLPPEDIGSNTGFRFVNVDIPRGATITSAVINMELAPGNPSDGQTMRIGIDTSLNPENFVDADLQPGSRDYLFMPDVMVDGESPGNDIEMDITDILQKHIQQPGWCGGEDIVLMIEDPYDFYGNNPHVIRALEAGGDVPELDIEWTHSGTSACFTKDVTIDIEGIGEDVEQRSDMVMEPDDTRINFGNGSKAGLRFSLVPLEGYNATNNLTVTDARLKIRAADNNPPGIITIYAVQEGVAKVWKGDDGELDARDLSNPITWIPNSWNSGTTYTSPNLASIIQPLLERSDWEYEGTIGLIISASTTSATTFYGWEWVSNNFRRRDVSTTQLWNAYGTRSAKLDLSVSSNVALETAPTNRRLRVESLRQQFVPGGGTPIAGSYVEAAEYMLGLSGYTSPLVDSGTCQANTLVLLTDGEETGSYSQSHFTNITGQGCNSAWNCNYSLATKLKNGANTSYGSREIKTYTIGYGPLDNTTKSRLQQVANNGDGQFFAASDAAKLATAFDTIIGSISDSGSSISVPGVAVSAFNRITLLDEVYYSLFKPTTTVNWIGNAKRYRLAGDAVVDVNGAAAIDGTTTYFWEESQSWWSEVPDGQVVYSGGAAPHIDVNDRRVYTYLGEYGSGLGETGGNMSNRGLDLSSGLDGALDIIQNDAPITANHLGLFQLESYPTMTGPQVAARRAKVLDWVKGGTDAAPRSAWGAPVHSSPVMIGYKEDGDSGLVSSIYVSTNEGYLHALDSGEPTAGSPAVDVANRGGKELFSFIPRDTLTNAAVMEENAEGDPIYGLDLTWSYWREGGDDTAITPNSDDHVYIYGGMRRGGHMLYGLNVSDVHFGGANEPKLLFAVGRQADNTSTPISGSPKGDVSDFTNIGQTWSDPKVRKVEWRGSERTVLLFGGGYDVDHDEISHEGADDVGNQVYMLDATTGELLWARETKNAITAGVRPYDRTGDSFVDSFYAVDLEGRVMRFDLNQAQDDFVPHTIAELGGASSDNRKFYQAPSIALLDNVVTNETDVIVAIGSGYRSQPDDKTITERFYVVYDRNAYTPVPEAPNDIIRQSNLLKASLEEGISDDPSDAESIYNIAGWFYEFDQNIGEKALGSPLIFNGLLLFTSYVTKNSGITTCTPVIGSTRLYIMDLNSKARTDIFGSASNEPFIEDLNPGIATDVQVVTIDGESALLIDKKIVKPDDQCELIGCSGRQLERELWETNSGGSNENQL